MTSKSFKRPSSKNEEGVGTAASHASSVTIVHWYDDDLTTAGTRYKHRQTFPVSGSLQSTFSKTIINVGISHCQKASE